MNITIIVLLIVDILLLLPFIIIFRKNAELKTAFDRTIYYFKSKMGFVISVNGPIRTGKTSSQSGLSSIAQLLIIQDIQELIEKTKMIFPNLDFNEIDNLIMNYYSKFTFKNKDDFPDFDLIANQIILLNDLDPKSYINNFIGNSNVNKLILDYCQALFAINVRNNFVHSKTPFYSHITGKFNLEFDVEWMSIRNAYKNKKYAIYDWTVILIDEVTDEAGSGNFHESLKDLSGAKEYRRKMGQIHQERNIIITTKQDVLDEVRKYRNLTHTNLLLEDRVSTVGNYYFIYSFIKKIISIYLFIHKHLVVKLKYLKQKYVKKNKVCNFGEFYEFYCNKTSVIRNSNNYLYYLKEFLTSIGYNRYYGKVLKRAEDIDKVSADTEEFYLFIPTMYCWGTYDTHLYKSMQTDLIKKSEVISKEIVPELDPHFFEEESNNSQTEDKGGDRFEF